MQTMNRLSIVLVVWGILVWGLPAHAKIYKWVDERGKVHFTNDPTQVPKDEETEIKTFRELPSLPVQKDEPEEPSSEKKTIPLYNEKGPVEPDFSIPPKVTRKKEILKKSPAEQRESYNKLLKEARESRERQLKKIADLQEMDEKPKNWTTKESLDEIIEGLKKNVRKSEKDILKYQNKIKSTSLAD